MKFNIIYNDKLINIIAGASVTVCLFVAFFLLEDPKVFFGCLCFLLAEKSLDYFYIKKKGE